MKSATRRLGTDSLICSCVRDAVDAAAADDDAAAADDDDDDDVTFVQTSKTTTRLHCRVYRKNVKCISALGT